MWSRDTARNRIFWKVVQQSVSLICHCLVTETSSLPVSNNLPLPCHLFCDNMYGNHRPWASLILSFGVMSSCNRILSELNLDECTSSDLSSDNCNSCDLNSSSAAPKWCKTGRCESKSGWSCLLTPRWGHTSWLSGHCPLLALNCRQVTVPAEAFPTLLAASVTAGEPWLLGRDRSWSVWHTTCLTETTQSSFTVCWEHEPSKDILSYIEEWGCSLWVLLSHLPEDLSTYKKYSKDGSSSRWDKSNRRQRVLQLWAANGSSTLNSASHLNEGREWPIIRAPGSLPPTPSIQQCIKLWPALTTSTQRKFLVFAKGILVGFAILFCKQKSLAKYMLLSREKNKIVFTLHHNSSNNSAKASPS